LNDLVKNLRARRAGEHAAEPKCANRLKILHVPFCYYPDSWGGTEVYVNSLALELESHGVQSIIAAPARHSGRYVHDRLTVHRFAVGEVSLRQAYGEPDRVAASHFVKILQDERPDIVHLHAFTAAVSTLLVDAAHDNGASVVFTYHTPTVACTRGTLMQWGNVPCDGLMRRRRCAACTLQKFNIPPSIAKLLAHIPIAVGRRLMGANVPNELLTLLGMPSLVEERHRQARRLFKGVDQVVAVCEWGYRLLVANGVPTPKLSLSRQGLPFPAKPNEVEVTRPEDPNRGLKVAFVGRLDFEKGIDVLALALSRLRDLTISIDVYGLADGVAPGPYRAMLLRMAAEDPRFSLKQAVDPRAIVEVLREYDLLAVPSRGFETGPLAIFEAFAAGIPVLGSCLGGITELVKDGLDGLLVSPDEPAAWADALRQVATERDLLSRLRANIRSPRTMESVAGDMLGIYQRLTCGSKERANTKDLAERVNGRPRDRAQQSRRDRRRTFRRAQAE
jgi:glycosyltransferase involved in cell wall biosynthesis